MTTANKKTDNKTTGAGRKPRAVTVPDQPEINQELIDDDAAKHDQLNHQLKTIDDQFSDNLPYDKTRIESECQFYLAQSTQAMLALGKRLILLKEHEAHGDFTDSLKRIGIEPRTARNMMKATLKFEGKTETVSVLERGKLYTLMTEDDEDLKALDEGGTVAGLTLDAIDKMSVRELKKELREAKAKAEEEQAIKEKQLQSKDDKINELDEKISKREIQLQSWEAQVDEINIAITTEAGKASIALDNLDILRDTMMTADLDPDHREAAEERMATNYIAVMKSLTIKIDQMMNDCLATVGAYEDRAVPLLEQYLERQESTEH